MSAGLERAYRDQEREARRHRERRDKRARDEIWTASDQSWACCASCGAEDAVGNFYHTGIGLQCPVCFSEGEDEITTTPPAPAWMLFARAIPFPLLPLPFYAHASGWVDLQHHQMFLALWMIGYASTFFGAPWGLMHIASVAKEDYYRPGIEDHERRRLLIGHGWLSLAILTGLSGTFWTFAMTASI